MQAEVKLYTIADAQLQQETSEALVVSPSTAPWLGGGLFAIVALVLLFSSQTMVLLAFLLFAIALYTVIDNPLSTRLSIDFRSGEAIYVADYLLYRPRHVEVRLPLSQISQVGIRPHGLGQGNTVEVVMADGTQIVLQFGRRAVSAEKFVGRLAALRRTATAASLNSLPASAEASRSVTQAEMVRELRSWGIGLLILGAAQMVASQGFSPWGVLLIAIGVTSFFLREPSMFMIYAATIAWSGLINVLVGDGWWKAFALLQAYWTFQLVRKFMRFRPSASPKVEAGADVPQAMADDGSGRSRRLFPPLAVILGGLSLVGLMIAIGGAIFNGLMIHYGGLTPLWGIVEVTAVFAGLLGLATGLAGWLAAYPQRWASIIGCAMGALTLAAHVGLMLLAK